MRAQFIEIGSPHFDNSPRLLQADEPVIVQAFISQFSVETLDIGILSGFSRLDQLYPDMMQRGPLIKHLAGEFRSLIGTNR